jgi:hypothetical protein
VNNIVLRIRRKIEKIERECFVPTKVIIGCNQWGELIVDPIMITSYYASGSNSEMFFGLPLIRTRRENYLGVLSNKSKKRKFRYDYGSKY